jgi:hypothetical protein
MFSKAEETFVGFYVEEYPEIVELGIDKVWIEGVENVDLAEEIAIGLDANYYPWRETVPGGGGWTRQRGWKVN